MYCTDKPCIGQNTTANPYLYASEMTRLIQLTAADPQHKPLFVFLALHNVHQPVESPLEFVDLYPASDYNKSNYARRVYNGMHSGVEFVLKNVTFELKAKGLWPTTVLVLAGDNGGTFEHGAPVPGSSNFPARGHKYSWFEGGVRVASFVASPLLPAHSVGTTSRALLSISDWWATFAVLGGLPPTDDCTGKPGCVPVDGRDAWPVLTQPPNASASEVVSWRTELLLGVGGAKQTGGALRNGSYKLIAPGGNSKSADGWSAQYPGTTPMRHPTASEECGYGQSHVCLFDLDQDPLEEHNLATSEPDLAAALLARYQALAKAAYAPNGDEAETARSGQRTYEECSNGEAGGDSCWLEHERGRTAAATAAVTAAAAAERTRLEAAVAPAATTPCALAGTWMIGSTDRFLFTTSSAPSESESAAVNATTDQNVSVSLTITGGCGKCAFTHATGTATLPSGAEGPASAITLVASGNGPWVSHTGTISDDGCRISWPQDNSTSGHHWPDFCKDSAHNESLCKGPSPKPPTPRPAPTPPTPPTPKPVSPACKAMLKTGYWAPWVADD